MREFMLLFFVVLGLWTGFALLERESQPPWAGLTSALIVDRAVALQIVDGDTLRVIWPDGRALPERVALYLADAPEGAACFAAEAAAFAEDALFGQPLWIAHQGRVVETEGGGALLGWVFTDRKRLDLWQARLLGEGMARLRRDGSDTDRLQTVLEPIALQARETGRGLWAACAD